MKNVFVLCVCCIALLVGCKAKERVVYQSRVDSVFVSRVDTFVREVEVLRTDTISARDSVVLREYVEVRVNEAGDTIWRDRVVYRDRWHDGEERSANNVVAQSERVREDVAREVKTDTIRVREVIKEAKKMTAIERIKGGVVYALGCLAAFAVCYIWVRRRG